MIKTFMLLATVINPNVAQNVSFVIDYNLTQSDCVAIMLDVAQSSGFEIEPGIIVSPNNIDFECQEQNSIPPCEFEDSDFCFWNADNRGNGQGDSFIAWNGEIYYLN